MGKFVSAIMIPFMVLAIAIGSLGFYFSENNHLRDDLIQANQKYANLLAEHNQASQQFQQEIAALNRTIENESAQKEQVWNENQNLKNQLAEQTAALEEERSQNALLLSGSSSKQADENFQPLNMALGNRFKWLKSPSSQIAVALVSIVIMTLGGGYTVYNSTGRHQESTNYASALAGRPRGQSNHFDGNETAIITVKMTQEQLRDFITWQRSQNQR